MILEAALMCLALNVIFEAGGEPFIGQIAVAEVTLNRADYNLAEVCDVVYAYKQFSWTHARIVHPPTRKEIETALKASKIALYGTNATDGATHYHADFVRPYWASEFFFIKKIGHHLFYKERE